MAEFSMAVAFLLGWVAGVVSAWVYGGYQASKAEQVTMSEGRRAEILKDELQRP